MGDIINILRKPGEDGEDEANRNLKDIFKRIEEMKTEDLENPSDDFSAESFRWYEEFAEQAFYEITESGMHDAKAKRQILTNSAKDFFDPRKRGGAMYTFAYQPETDDLDYWDKFPLVIRMLDNLDSTESFLGINLHYLEPKMRRMFLVFMMRSIRGSLDNKDSRILGMNIEKLALGFAKYGRVCIRRYKYDNIRGKVLRIPPEHWIKMIYLPTYQFIGGKPRKVWRDSFKKIRRLK